MSRGNGLGSMDRGEAQDARQCRRGIASRQINAAQEASIRQCSTGCARLPFSSVRPVRVLTEFSWKIENVRDECAEISAQRVSGL